MDKLELTDEQILALPEDKIKAALCRADFKEYYKLVMGDSYMPGKHIDTMCDTLMRVYKQVAIRFAPKGFRDNITMSNIEPLPYLIVNMPPQHSKTLTISQIFATWVMGKIPNFPFIVASYGGGWAEHISQGAKEIVQKHGWVFEMDVRKDFFANDNWKCTNGSEYAAAGVSGVLSGRPAWGMSFDDPYKDWNDAHSATVIQTVEDWFYSTFTTRLRPGGFIIIPHTRWNQLDITGHLLTKMAHGEGQDWHVLDFKLLNQDRTECLWPERYPLEYCLEIERTRPPHIFSAMYQQYPIPTEGVIIQSDWLKYWEELPPKFDMTVIAVDMNFKETKKGSFACYEAWGVAGANRYLIDQVRGRWQYNEAKRQFRMFCAKHPEIMLKLIEDKANGPAIISDLQNEIPGIVPIQVKDSKEARFWGCQPVFEAGNVWIPAHAYWVGDWMAEICSFSGPGTTPNNDQVDCTSMALDRLKTISSGEIITGKSHREALDWDKLENVRGNSLQF